jgi:hypothetical protein
VLLLHMEASGMVDSSSYARSATADGSTQEGSTKVFGTYSRAYSGSVVTRWADAAEFTLGSAAFALQFFVRFGGAGSLFNVFGQSNSAGATTTNSIFISRTAGDRIRAIASSGGSAVIDITGTTAISSGTWYYVGFGRTGNTFNLYVGVPGGGAATLDGTGSSSATLNDSSNALGLGCLGETGTNLLSGQVDELRFTVGSYRSDLGTVPTSAFPNS